MAPVWLPPSSELHLTCSPPPQDTVHSPQSPQVLQTPAKWKSHVECVQSKESKLCQINAKTNLEYRRKLNYVSKATTATYHMFSKTPLTTLCRCWARKFLPLLPFARVPSGPWGGICAGSEKRIMSWQRWIIVKKYDLVNIVKNWLTTRRNSHLVLNWVPSPHVTLQPLRGDQADQPPCTTSQEKHL